MEKEDKAFFEGFAAAIASLIRSHDQPGMAVHVARTNGVDLKDFEDAEVDSFDLDPIRKAFRDEGH